MQKKTKRLLIWLPIVAVLIIAIIVGACFYFNSNQYRFRKSAFYCEYANLQFLDDRTFDAYPFLFYLFEQNENGGYTQVGVSSFTIRYKNGKYFTKDIDNVDQDVDTLFEDAVTNEIKKYYNIFTEKCVVMDEEIKFLPSGETLKIIDNKFLYEWHWSSGEEYPIRRFKTVGGSLNLNGSGFFQTSYMDTSGGLFPRPRSLDLDLDVYFEGKQKKYKMYIRVFYVNISDYNEIRNKQNQNI